MFRRRLLRCTATMPRRGPLTRLASARSTPFLVLLAAVHASVVIACAETPITAQQAQLHLLSENVPNESADAKCSDATFVIYPDGRIKYNATARGTEGAQDATHSPTLCLHDYDNRKWAQPLFARVLDNTQCIQIDDAGCGVKPAPIQTEKAYRIADTPDGVIRIDILGQDSKIAGSENDDLTSKVTASWYSALRAVESDSDLATSVGFETGCVDTAANKALASKLAQAEFANRKAATQPDTSSYSVLLASFLLPARPRTEQTITVDGRSGSNATNLLVRDGATINVWAFNVRSDGSQQLAILQGGKVVQTTAVGPLLLAGLSALGSPLSVSATALPPPSGTTTAPPTPSNTTAAPTPSAAPTASGSPTPLPASTNSGGTSGTNQSDDSCSCVAAPNSGGCFQAREVVKRALATRLGALNMIADYTAVMSFASVTGGYNYTAAVLDSTLTSLPRSPNSALTPPQDTVIAPISPVVGASSFKTFASHRVASLIVEEAYNAKGQYATSGYGYVPISQTSGDQLYQLQALDRTGDHLTLSALAVAYPFALIHERWARYPWGLGLAFGPTLMRGSTSELLKQWNLRFVWEADPFHLPYIAFSVGPSWRMYDTIDRSYAGVGSVVSIPRPATAPTFPTESKVDLVWSVGLSIDLAVLTDAVAAVSNAASSSSGGGTGSGKGSNK